MPRPMSAFAPARYARAERIIVLAATYGDGDAPASAKGFLDRLTRARARARRAARRARLRRPQLPGLLRLRARPSRPRPRRRAGPSSCRSTRSTASRRRTSRAGAARSAQALGIDLELAHQPVAARDRDADARLAPRLRRRGAGADRDPALRPAARHALAAPDGARLRALRGGRPARHPAGGLAPCRGSIRSPPGSRDGFVEIVVKKHPGGLCSGQLTALEPGDTVTAFLRRNPGFQPGRGRAPLILIGAGTGIGPLAGLRARQRAAAAHPPVLRDAPSRQRLPLRRGALRPGRPRAAWPGWSRRSRAGRGPTTCRTRCAARRAEVARLIRDGARVMVCGGRDMAAGRRRRAGRDPRARRADAGGAEGGGAVCRRCLLTWCATR